MEEGTKTHMGFWSSLSGRNIITRRWKRRANPYGNIDRGNRQHIRMYGI